jgi:hypothetical protein
MNPRIDTGNWEAFQSYPIEHVFEIAATWRARVKGEKKLWLCWNVSPRWSVVQQRLARLAGWTPLVGFDPRVGPPPVEPGAILIDFNEGLARKLPHVAARNRVPVRIYWRCVCAAKRILHDRLASQQLCILD